MKLSFGNMTLEMNIFNICKQPGDDNDLQKVDFTETLVHDQFQTTSSETKIDESDDVKWFIFRKNQTQIVGDQKLKNCHHDQLSPYLQLFNHQNLI
jgi:hypothetical protein